MAPAAMLALAACSAPPGLQGTILDPPLSPTHFALSDQSGQTTRSEDFRGKVVVLSFMYTKCPDVCPLLAAKLRQVQQGLGDAASDVAFVVISVDPENDTPAAALEFSRRHGMEHGWSYLVGPRDQLAAVWDHYFVESHRPGDDHPLLEHSSPLYLLDRRGEARVLLTGDKQELDLISADVRNLLRQPWQSRGNQ